MRDSGSQPAPLDFDRLRALLIAHGWMAVGGGPGFAVGVPRQTPSAELDVHAEDAGLGLRVRFGAYPASERRERLLAQLNLWNRTQPTPKAICLQDPRGRGVVEAQARLSLAPGSDAGVCARLNAELRAVERLFEALWKELEGLLTTPLRLPNIRPNPPSPHPQPGGATVSVVDLGGALPPGTDRGALDGDVAEVGSDHRGSDADRAEATSPRIGSRDGGDGIGASAGARRPNDGAGWVAADAGPVAATPPEADPEVEDEAVAGAEAVALDAARAILGARSGWALVDAPQGRPPGFTAHPPHSQDSLRVQVQGGHLRVMFAEQQLPEAWTRREAYAAANELNRHLRATVWVPSDEAELRIAGALSVPLNEGAAGVAGLLAAISVEAQALAGFLSGAGCTPGAAPAQPSPSEPGALPLLLSQAQLEAAMQEKALAIYRDSEGDLGAFIDHDRFQLRRVGAELSVIAHWHMSLREEQLDRLRRKLNALNDEYLCVTAYSTRVEDDRISVQTSVSIDHHQGVTQAQLHQQLHCAITATREVFAELLNTFTE